MLDPRKFVCVYFSFMVWISCRHDRAADAREAISVSVNPPEQIIYSSVLRLPARAAISIDVDSGDSSDGMTAYYSLKVTLIYWKSLELVNQTLLNQPAGRMSSRQSLKLQLMSFNAFALHIAVQSQVTILRMQRI